MILVDQVVCVLLCEAKAIIWKFSEFRNEAWAFESRSRFFLSSHLKMWLSYAYFDDALVKWTLIQVRNSLAEVINFKLLYIS
jgi:hypothetical protein